jgi:ATP-dependent DNA ligase
MTGKPAKDAADLIKSLSKKVDRGKLTADYKYDGERTQIHWDQTSLSMFSRSCDDQKAKFWSLYS